MTAFEDELFQKAILYYSDGDAQSAISVMKRLIKENPTSGAYNGYLGTIYFNMKRYHLSRDYFKVAVRANPRSDTASIGFFHSLWGLGFIKAALNEIDRYCSHSYLQDYREIVDGLLASELVKDPKYKKILCRIDDKIQSLRKSIDG